MLVTPMPRFTVLEGGLYAWLLLPYPSWPPLPKPQHLTVSSSKITQVCSKVELTDFAVRPEPRFTAVDLGAVVEPEPPPYPIR